MQTLQSARQLISGDILGLNLGTEINYQTQAESCEIFLQNLLQILPWTRSDGPFTHFLTLFSFIILCPAEVNNLQNILSINQPAAVCIPCVES